MDSRSILARCVMIFIFIKVVCSRELQLLSDGSYNVSWEFSGLNPNDFITFTISAKTTGWVGLGVSQYGEMEGGDFWIAWVDSSGFGYLKDMYRTLGDGNGLPELDLSSDVTLLNASETNGVTTITFKRKLDTCDSKDRVINEDTARLLFAHGPKDPNKNVLSASDYHGGNRGARSVFLFENEKNASLIPDDALTFDTLENNYTIPGNSDTTYHCTFHRIPNLTKPHQIIAVDTVMTPGNEDIVHHILFHACLNISEEILNSSTEALQGGQCFSPELPPWWSSCQNNVFGWAVGGSKLIFPENVGYTIEDGIAPVVFMMEIHYSNHHLVSGRKDSSGFRFTYTSKLRTYSSDMLQVGSVAGIFVPPQTDRFRVTGFCHGSCTQDWIPPSGITIFGYFLHAHLLGVAIQVDWYRNGKAVGILAVDDQYDFNFQENKMLKNPVKLLPGDSLKVTCSMTSDRTNVTYGGFGTQNEMCLAFFMYYPRQTIALCQTLPMYMYNPFEYLYSSLKVKPHVLNTSVDVEKTLDSVSWTSDLVSKAQAGVDDVSLYSVCMRSGRSVYPSFGKIFYATDFAVLLERKKVESCPGVEDIDSEAALQRITPALICFPLAIAAYMTAKLQ